MFTVLGTCANYLSYKWRCTAIVDVVPEHYTLIQQYALPLLKSTTISHNSPISILNISIFIYIYLCFHHPSRHVWTATMMRDETVPKCFTIKPNASTRFIQQTTINQSYVSDSLITYLLRMSTPQRAFEQGRLQFQTSKTNNYSYKKWWTDMRTATGCGGTNELLAWLFCGLQRETD
jgi:hypothetical protein